MGQPPEQPNGQQPYGGPPYWQQPEGEPQYVPQPPPFPGQQYPGQQYPGYPAPPGYPYAGYPAPPGYPYAGYGYPVPAGARVSDPSLGWLALGAALLAVLGGVLPWATVFGISIYDANGDGGLVIGCAVIAGACGIAIGIGKGRLWASITSTVFGLLIGLIGLVDTASVSRLATGTQIPSDIAPVSVGIGLWLTIVAGLLITGLGAVAIVRRRPATLSR